MKDTTQGVENPHYRIVEQGKVHALNRNYSEALRHYREGIRMCQKEPGADLFFQHYSQCAMETLELSGAYKEVIDFCQKTRQFLEDKQLESVYVKKYRASLFEREAIQHLFLGDKNEATVCFKAVQTLVGSQDFPLTGQLLNWLQRGYTIGERQIKDAQKTHHYFSVRTDNVNPLIAMQLPDTMITI